MKWMRSCLYGFVLMLGVTPVEAREHEIYQFSQLLKIVGRGDLLVIDIDDTLLFPAQYLGSTFWVHEHIRTLVKGGWSRQEAYEQTCSLWKQVLRASKMYLIEDSVSQVINQLQDQGVTILGMSKRDPCLGYLTADQLRVLNVDLLRTAAVRADIDVSHLKNIRFVEGCLFFGCFQDRVSAFIEFLRLLPHLPNKVIYVDNLYKHVTQMEQACSDLGIDYEGVWYPLAEEKEDSYRADLAQIQLKHFERIFSDQDAQKLMQAGMSE